MTFTKRRRYNRIFQQVIQKVGYSLNNYIKIFENAKDLTISVGNSYSEYQLIRTFLDNLQQGGKHPVQIARYQAVLRR